MASSISSPGLGSGLDVNGLVSKLMQIESQPLAALATKEASYQAKLTAYGTLKGALSSLQTAASTLKTASTFTGRTASVSDTSVLTASASSTAIAGTYDIAVSKLAKANIIRTNVDYGTGTFESGTLTIQIGSGTAVDVEIAAGKTLSEIATAINDSSAGVTAAVVDDGTADRLVLTSDTSGTSGDITFSATTDGGDGQPLTDLVGANLTPVQASQDAALTINGLSITRSSNTITDAITGVTLNLAKADLATPPSAKLTVGKDTATVAAAVSTFVKAYNDAYSSLKSLSAYDSANKQASVLTGDSTVRSILSQLGSMVHTSVTGISGGISRLSDIGITVQKDGTLKTDSSKLTTALNDSTKDVASFFTQTTSGNTGIAVRFYSTLHEIVDSGGMIPGRTDGISASIKDIGRSREALTLRLESIEKRYRSQFTALDSLIASLQRTSNYLSQQLASLPGSSSGS